MEAGGIILLSTSDRVIAAVRRAAQPADVLAVGCLNEARIPPRGATLVIDPSSVHPCCLERLAEWSKRQAVARVIHLSRAAPPDVLLSLPLAHPGVVVRVQDIGPALGRTRPSAPSARTAWRARGRLLSRAVTDKRLRTFLKLARDPRYKGDVAGMAAAALHLSVRHLSRLVRRWFGHSPRTILGLIKVERIGKDLEQPGLTLKTLAFAHGYAHRQALERLFASYTGLTPAVYRRKMQPNRTSGNDALNSSNRLCQTRPITVHRSH